MTKSPTQQAVSVEHTDRVIAWDHRPHAYCAADYDPWMAGRYDSIKVIQDFARHRLSADDMLREAIEKLTNTQRKAIKTSIFVAGGWALTTDYEDHPDIMEGLPEGIADPVSGILTPFGNRVRQALRDAPVTSTNSASVAECAAPPAYGVLLPCRASGSPPHPQGAESMITETKPMKKRMQTRAVWTGQLPEGWDAVTPPTVELIDYLASVFLGRRALQMIEEASETPNPMQTIAIAHARHAGQEQVIGHLREMLKQAAPKAPTAPIGEAGEDEVR